ncbi:trypsin [Oesophagostomum dentatum]|uniref:Trypsin n=1 Tax=Oesophagostomum dentatum TaxID=61180 RepID=A0A0B1TB63_OESDE|nr:trypsin [Oesophagostomum dentatum]
MKILWIFVLSLAHTTYAGLVPLENTIPSLADTTYPRLSPEENINLQQTCGREHPLFKKSLYKVLKGTEVQPNEFSFMGAIRTFLRRRLWESWNHATVNLGDAYKNFKESHCSAVLISKRHVLTAAHCVLFPALGQESYCRYHRGYIWVEKEYVQPSDLKVYVGTRCPKWGSCVPNRTVYEATSIVPYPYYETCWHTNDIAIVELGKDVDESDGIPICMPNENERLSETLLAVGYGHDLSAATNQDKPGLQLAEFHRYNDQLEASQIISVDSVQSLCKGDSGGPLFHKKDGRYTLLGIASHITPNCSDPAVERQAHHTDVRKFLGWICEKTGVCPTA